MKSHKLKTIQPYFEQVWRGSKKFEVRKNDRDFKRHDEVYLQEYDTISNSYSGREVRVNITYILGNYEPIKEGFIVFSFDILQYINKKH